MMDDGQHAIKGNMERATGPDTLLKVEPTGHGESGKDPLILPKSPCRTYLHGITSPLLYRSWPKAACSV